MKTIAFAFVVLALSTGISLGQSIQPKAVPGTETAVKTVFKNNLLNKIKALSSDKTSPLYKCNISFDGNPTYDAGARIQGKSIDNGTANKTETAVCPYKEFFRVSYEASCPGQDYSKTLEFMWTAEMLTDDKEVCQVSKKVNDSLAESRSYKKNDIKECCNLMKYMDLKNTDSNTEIQWASDKASNAGNWIEPPHY